MRQNECVDLTFRHGDFPSEIDGEITEEAARHGEISGNLQFRGWMSPLIH